MKTKIKLLLALALTGGAVSSASAAVIDFDTLSGGPIFAGELLTTQYQGLGVTFSDSFSGGAHANNSLGVLIAGSTAPNVLWINQGGGSTTGQFLQVSFASAVHGLSLDYGTSLSADVTLEAYNGASLINSVNEVGATVISDVRSGHLAINDAGITSIRLFSHSGSSSFNFSIDNLNVSAVPEADTYAMMLAGLGLLGFVSRRRHTA